MLRPSLLLPREKLKMHGVQTLQLHELIAIIVGSGNKKKDVITLSQEITTIFLNQKSRNEVQNKLMSIEGLGNINQMKAVALYELLMSWSHIQIANQTEQIMISNPEDIVFHFRSHFINWSQEMLLGIYLDGKNCVLSCEKLFLGTIDSVEIHPREIFSPALFKSAKSIIIMHNHPSGNRLPSEADIKTTKQLATLGKTMGIPIVDHIIITQTDFISLKRESYF